MNQVDQEVGAGRGPNLPDPEGLSLPSLARATARATVQANTSVQSRGDSRSFIHGVRAARAHLPIKVMRRSRGETGGVISRITPPGFSGLAR